MKAKWKYGKKSLKIRSSNYLKSREFGSLKIMVEINTKENIKGKKMEVFLMESEYSPFKPERRLKVNGKTGSYLERQ